MLEFNMQGVPTEIDLQDVETFVKSEKFAQFLLANTEEFESAAFILQVLLNAVEAAKEES